MRTLMITLLLTAAVFSPLAAADRSVDQWIDLLHSPDVQTRVKASASLAALGRKAVPALIDAFDYAPNYEVQQVLVTIGPAAVPELVACLGVNSSQGQWYCPSVLLRVGEPALPELRKAKATGSDPLKRRAAEVLGRFDTLHDKLLPRLRESLTSPDSQKRGDAINSLKALGTGFGGTGAVAAVPSLILALRDSDRENRLDAAAQIGEIGPGAAGAIPALARLYAEAGADAEMRSMVLWSIAEIGAPTGEAFLLIRKGLRDHSREIAQMAIYAVRELGQRGLHLTEALIEALPASALMTRKDIVATLRDLYDEVDHAPVLRRALDHPSVHVRFAVAQLVRYEEGGVEAALPALVEGLALEEAEDRRTAVREINDARTTDQLTLSAADYDSAVRSLLHIIEHDDPPVRENAHQLVLRIGPPQSRSVSALAQALSSGNAQVRLVAATLLGRTGSAAEPALPELQRRSSDPEAQVRLETVRAIAAITNDSGALISWLGDASAEVRAAAVAALSRFEPVSPSVASTLASLLDDSSAEVRAEAAKALKKIPPSKVVLVALTSHLHDEDARAGAAISDALAAFPGALPFIALVLGSERGVEQARAQNIGRALCSDSPDAALVREYATALIRGRTLRPDTPEPGLVRLRTSAVMEILDTLHSLSGPGRVAAMLLLGRVQIPAETLPPIAELLGERDENVRLAGVAVLRKGGETGHQLLIDQLMRGPVQARAAAAFGLSRTLPVSRIDPGIREDLARAAVPALLAALDDEDAEVRRAAAASIGSFGPAGADAGSRLTEMLGDAERQSRLAAGFALHRVDAFGLNLLQSALCGDDRSVRRGAAEALGALYQAACGAEDSLRKAAGDADAEVAREAALALTKVRREIYHVGRTKPPKPEGRVSVDLSTVAQGKSQSVDVMLVIDERGEVEDAWILRGDSSINAAALTTVAQWRYAPATIEGKPVAVFLPARVELSRPESR